ncbi:MAG TPA: hypothetical protein PK175_02535 [Syntrophales bacterium]|nr:hypothetical protein [Syntrophales bacterium]HON24127.1 hypothetical protein [Syntrophales bacterium]HOU77723.1 hypothetical protein [Syntrophales bacterium]HQG33734.1 hypothetical protein [Syntrophales bacterium]HQJ30172.1 hypothetical protein [Syntrophales bacterium]
MGERVMGPGEKIFDLVDVVEEGMPDFSDLPERKPKIALVNPNIQEEMIRKVEETTERLVREMFPSLAERIIREEIEKLKQ